MTTHQTTDPSGDEAEIDALVGDMTLAEKCMMLTGSGPWIVPGCERLSIPDWRTSDGPIGVRGMQIGTGLVLPGESALAATWDPATVAELGAALGVEAIDRHVDVLLGPTVNLHRSPLAGRHFECFSEDPELSAEIASAYIRGVQSTGVAACIKHFVGNDQETERTTIDVRIDDGTLHEVYLRPFEAAVRDAGVRTLMAAYNYVNGHHATAQPDLLVDVLRRQWGFDGVVISDWSAAKETVAPALHGLDLEMPGPGAWWGGGRLREAVESGDVPAALIDEKVRHILGLLAWRGRLHGDSVTADEVMVERDGDRALVRRAAASGMVLIKNDGTLPLSGESSVALVGPGVEHTALLGGGSASLVPYRSTSVLESLQRRWDGDIAYAIGVDLRRRAPTVPFEWLPDGVRVDFFANDDCAGEPVASESRLAVHNVFLPDNLPDVGWPISAKVSFTLQPDETGHARMFCAAFGRCRLSVDGEVVADNQVDQFSAGLGLSAGTGDFVLQSGRRYQIELEVRPSPGSTYPLILFDVGIAMLPIGGREAQLADAVAAAAAADVAVVVVGSSDEWEAEGRDRSELRLPADQDELVRSVAAVNSRTIVVLNCGAPMEMPWIDDVEAVLLAWYPGQEGGEAIVDVLLGDVSPGGRMPTTWPRRLEDTPSFDHYPGENGTVTYGEGLLVGHRWYDLHDIEPLVPFGHGLTYTTFGWGTPTISAGPDSITVAVDVTNTGDRHACEVVQVYVEPPERGGDRPVRTLGGFAKVSVAPGATETALVVLPLRRLARWSGSEWVVDAGEYALVVAASAVDLRSKVAHIVDDAFIVDESQSTG